MSSHKFLSLLISTVCFSAIGTLALVNPSPRLSFLGSFNDKLYYIERINKTSQQEARTTCQNHGLNLLKVDSPEEVDWILSTTTAADDEIWTDGVNNVVHSSFTWVTLGVPVSEELKLSDRIPYGLLFSRMYSGRLTSQIQSVNRTYICYENANATINLRPFQEVYYSQSEGVALALDIENVVQQEPPLLSWVGNYAGLKSYWLVAYITGQETSRTTCGGLEMKMALIESQKEVEWLIATAPVERSGFWTDAATINDPSTTYKWATDNSPLNSRLDVQDPHLGLVVVNGDDGPTLQAANIYSGYYYFCYSDIPQK